MERHRKPPPDELPGFRGVGDKLESREKQLSAAIRLNEHRRVGWLLSTYPERRSVAVWILKTEITIAAKSTTQT